MGKRAKRTKQRFQEGQPLSRRQYQIAILAVEGLPAKDIATKLEISKRTVDSHMEGIYKKLGVNNRIKMLRMFEQDDKIHVSHYGKEIF